MQDVTGKSWHYCWIHRVRCIEELRFSAARLTFASTGMCTRETELESNLHQRFLYLFKLHSMVKNLDRKTLWSCCYLSETKEWRVENNAVDAASRKCFLLHERNLLQARNSFPLCFFPLSFLNSVWFQNSKGVWLWELKFYEKGCYRKCLGLTLYFKWFFKKKMNFFYFYFLL